MAHKIDLFLSQEATTAIILPKPIALFEMLIGSACKILVACAKEQKEKRKKMVRINFIPLKYLNFIISKAIGGMIIDHSRSLHISITNGRAYKFETSLF